MVKIGAIISLVSLLLISCVSKSSSDESSASSKEIKIDGSSTVYPITEAVAEEFRSVKPNTKVTIGMSGTGGGFKKFIRGEIDINNASRPIKQQESEACKEKNIRYLKLRIAYDGLAISVNKENTWVDYFTVEELKKIWRPEAQATITKWSQIRQGWPDKEFNLYGPGIASGTYDYFTKVIIGQEASSRGDYTASEDDNILVQGVAGDKYAIGFFGMAYYEENQERLSLIGVDNGDGPVKPTKETVRNGTYKPLSRPIFIYVRKAALQRTETLEFVHFYLKNVASLVDDVGYVALPQAVYEQNMKILQDFLSAE